MALVQNERSNTNVPMDTKRRKPAGGRAIKAGSKHIHNKGSNREASEELAGRARVPRHAQATMDANEGAGATHRHSRTTHSRDDQSAGTDMHHSTKVAVTSMVAHTQPVYSRATGARRNEQGAGEARGSTVAEDMDSRSEAADTRTQGNKAKQGMKAQRHTHEREGAGVLLDLHSDIQFREWFNGFDRGEQEGK